MALQEAAKRAKLVLLEPMMKLQAITPEQFMGDVIGDISSKRGHVESMEDRGEGAARVKVINAQVPLSEMFGYATSLRSMTQGRASFTMEFDHYAEIPGNITQQIVEGRKK
ncbi:MAG: Elongation factor G [Parcubacteria group bacterium GW2011_GWB1_42_6]|nr:MAG: Elongation factor G [Parcubacteria group bacterium GW2011_GWB1_42_6]